MMALLEYRGFSCDIVRMNGLDVLTEIFFAGSFAVKQRCEPA
jgi:hypothetical protein